MYSLQLHYITVQTLHYIAIHCNTLQYIAMQCADVYTNTYICTSKHPSMHESIHQSIHVPPPLHSLSTIHSFPTSPPPFFHNIVLGWFKPPFYPSVFSIQCYTIFEVDCKKIWKTSTRKNVFIRHTIIMCHSYEICT